MLDYPVFSLLRSPGLLLSRCRGLCWSLFYSLTFFIGVAHKILDQSPNSPFPFLFTLGLDLLDTWTRALILRTVHLIVLRREAECVVPHGVVSADGDIRPGPLHHHHEQQQHPQAHYCISPIPILYRDPSCRAEPKTIYILSFRDISENE